MIVEMFQIEIDHEDMSEEIANQSPVSLPPSEAPPKPEGECCANSQNELKLLPIA